MYEYTQHQGECTMPFDFHDYDINGDDINDDDAGSED